MLRTRCPTSLADSTPLASNQEIRHYIRREELVMASRRVFHDQVVVGGYRRSRRNVDIEYGFDEGGDGASL